MKEQKNLEELESFRCFRDFLFLCHGLVSFIRTLESRHGFFLSLNAI